MGPLSSELISRLMFQTEARGELRAIILSMIAAASLTACSEVRYEAGAIPGHAAGPPGTQVSKRPSMAMLEGTLNPGVSTKSEVLAAIGRQTGAGAIYLPIDRGPRETWSYYYEEGSVRAERGSVVGESRRTFLFIYFDGDRYDGYMWFSSLP